MPPKKNPLKLNKLQLRTLALLQELARNPETSSRDDHGEALINQFPHAHGDHMHIGRFTVSAADASGFGNEGVWKALDRKGLARNGFPTAIVLTVRGQDYETGLFDEAMLAESDH